MVICSISTFREYIKVSDDSVLDASGVISIECFNTWLQRKRATKSEKQARIFLRILGSHLGGFDKRVPFTLQEEAAILLVVRVKRVWPCFEGLDVTLGKRGFRSLGYHEKLAVGKVPARAAAAPATMTTPRLAPKRCQGMEPSPRGEQPMHFIHLDDVIPDELIFSMDEFDTCVIADLVCKITAVPFYLKLVVGYVVGVQEIENSLVIKALAWLHAFLAAKQQPLALLAALLAFPKFRLGLGRKDADVISLADHLFRLVAFRRVDLKLAPTAPLYQLIWHGVIKQGLWKRHIAELEFSKLNGDSLKIYIPFQRFDRTKPATMINFLSNPADVEMVLTDRETFPTRGHTGFTEIVGEGLLGLPSGEMHSAHRAMVINFLSDKHLKNYAVLVSEQVEVMLDKWGCGLKHSENNKTVVNAQYDLSMLTLDIIMVTAFGAKPEYLSQHIPEKDNHLAHALDVVLKDIVIRTVMPGYQYIPTPLQFYINRMINEANELQRKLYDDCKKRIAEDGPNAPSSMLSEMLKHGLPDSEVANELQTIRGAGHETTSNTLSWVMLLLAQNPDKLAKLQQEVDSVVKGNSCTFEESKQLKYASQVVLETLRLYPTVPHFPRECHRDVQLKSGYDVMAGSVVFVSQAAMNRNREVWGDDAEEFVPERFQGVGDIKMGVPVGVPNGGPKYGFAPFGAANRSCVGQRLAILEANQILGTVVKRCNWRLVEPEKEVEQVADVTLGPKHGLMFEMSPRYTAPLDI